MKKLICLIILLGGIILNTKAQQPCVPCEPVTVFKTEVIPICWIWDSIPVFMPDLNNPNCFYPDSPGYNFDLSCIPDLSAPARDSNGVALYHSYYMPITYLLIETRTVNCDGNSTTVVNKATYINNSSIPIIDSGMMFRKRPLIDTSELRPLKFSCNYGLDTASDLKAALKFALSELAITEQSNLRSIFWEIGCMAFIKARFPNDTIYEFWENGATKKYPIGGLHTSLVPCTDLSCCSVTFYEDPETKRIVITESTGPASCDSPITAMLNTVPSFWGQDSAGNPKQFFGVIHSTEPCQSMCELPQSLKYAIDTKKGNEASFQSLPPASLQDAKPTMVNNHIKFNNIAGIEQIIIRDGLGREVKKLNHLQSNVVNLSDLPNGIYYVQLFLSNAEVRLIKIAKY